MKVTTRRFVMNTFLSTLLLTPLVFSGFLFSGQAHAQTRSLEHLRDELQVAVCLNNWDDALSLLSPMIGSSDITASYREELIRFRQQVQNWRATRAEFSNQSNCDDIIAQAEADAAAETAAREDAIQAADAARQNAILSQPEVRNTTRSTSAQCLELAAVINWVDSEARSLMTQVNTTDPASLIRMIERLADLSALTVTNLQSLQLSDNQLRTYQQRFTTIYQSYISAIRMLVNAINSASLNLIQQQDLQIETLVNQEANLVSELNSFCGQNVITVQ